MKKAILNVVYNGENLSKLLFKTYSGRNEYIISVPLSTIPMEKLKNHVAPSVHVLAQKNNVEIKKGETKTPEGFNSYNLSLSSGVMYSRNGNFVLDLKSEGDLEKRTRIPFSKDLGTLSTLAYLSDLAGAEIKAIFSTNQYLEICAALKLRDPAFTRYTGPRVSPRSQVTKTQ